MGPAAEILLAVVASAITLIASLVYDRGNRDHGAVRERVAALELRVWELEQHNEGQPEPARKRAKR